MDLKDALIFKRIFGGSGGSSGGGIRTIYIQNSHTIKDLPYNSGLDMYKVSDDTPSAEKLVNGIYGIGQADSSAFIGNAAIIKADEILEEYGAIGWRISGLDIIGLLSINESAAVVFECELGLYLDASVYDPDFSAKSVLIVYGA